MRKLQRSMIGILFVLLLYSGVNAQSSSPEGHVPVQIISQPKATYTDVARTKGAEGVVRLKITLLANGEVGTVTVVKTRGWKKMEKYGLTQKAIAAAKQIRFTPKHVEGVAVPVVITREYTFEVY